jgi:tetratricopeptide (TPR) repeat protein
LAFLASVGSLYQLALLLAERGQFAEAAIRGDEAVRIAETTNHPFSVNTAYFCIGYVQLRKGAIDKAISMLERSLELCRVWDLQQNFLRVAANLGYAYAAAGRIAESLSLLEQATKQSSVHRHVVGSVGEGYLLTGRVELANQFATRALESSRRNKTRSSEALALRLLGDIKTKVKPAEVDEAENCYVEAITVAEELGMRPLIAHCHVGLGKLYRDINKTEKAKPHLSDGVAMMREMEMGLWLERAETELKELG